MVKRPSPSINTNRAIGREGSRSRPSSAHLREDLTKFIGVQSCLSLFEARKKDIRRVLLLEEQEERFGHIIRWCSKRGVVTKSVSFEELSRFAATEHHEGVCIEAKPLPLVPLSEMIRHVGELQRGVIAVLEGVENPHNVGAILRTCCFFGVTSVIIQSSVISTLSAAACRIAEGAAEKMAISIVREYGRSFSILKERGFSVVATTPHDARSLYSVKWPERVLLLFGAEAKGLSRESIEMADVRVVIPRLGPLESLNVGAAVSSVLTEARREAVVKGVVRRVAL